MSGAGGDVGPRETVPSLSSALLSGGTDHELSSVFSTCVNIVCAVIGAGILALPKGLSSSGWSGMILLALVPPLYKRVVHAQLDSEAARLAS